MRRPYRLALAGACALALSLSPARAQDSPIDRVRERIAGSDPAIVKLEPSRTRPRVGVTFKVTIRISGARDVGSVPFALRYDPALLEFLPGRSNEGGFLSGDGPATSFLARAGPLPGGGTGVVVGLSRLDGRLGASGSGSLCTLTFRARSPGIATLSFVRGTILSPKTEELPSHFEGGSVKVRPAR